jgi:hypothetical protein
LTEGPIIQAGYFFNFKYVGVGQIFKEYQVPFNKSDDLKRYIDEYKGFIPSVFYNSEEYYSASIDDILIVPTGIKNELIKLDGFILLNRIKPKQLFIHGLSNLNKILSDDLFGYFGIAGNFNIQDVSGSFVQPYYIHKLSNTLKLKSSITFQNNNSSFTDLISYATEAYYSHDLFKISSRLNYNNDIGFGYSITVDMDDFVYFFPRYSVVLGYNDTACLNNIPTTGFYFGFFSKITVDMR